MYLLQDLASQVGLVLVVFEVFELTPQKEKIWARYSAHGEVNDIRVLFGAISGRALDCDRASEFSVGSGSRTY